MKWTHDVYIDGDLSWPSAVNVIRSQTKEMRRYVLEEVCVPHGEWKAITQTQEVRRMYCDCGYELGMDERGSMPFNYTHLFSMPRYCPECGRRLMSRGKVVEE